MRTPDCAQQDEEYEEEPHGQAQAHETCIVFLHVLSHKADEVKFGTCACGTSDIERPQS